MRRATISLPDELEERVERFRNTQPARPSLTSVVQVALEAYLQARSTSEDSQALLSRILRHRADIRSVVDRHGGSNPRLFGSVARGEGGQDSDVDLLIELESGRTLFDLAAMRAELQDLLDVPVDIVTTSGLEGEARKRILAEALAL